MVERGEGGFSIAVDYIPFPVLRQAIMLQHCLLRNTSCLPRHIYVIYGSRQQKRAEGDLHAIFVFFTHLCHSTILQGQRCMIFQECQPRTADLR